jgi:hypothetical protein
MRPARQGLSSRGFLHLIFATKIPRKINGPRALQKIMNSAVRPEGADHQWRRVPPGELSIVPVADKRSGRVTGWAGAS